MKLFHALLKWIALLALTLSVELLAIIFLAPRPEIDSFLLRIILLLAVALFSSLAGRLLFRRLPAMLLLLVAVLTSLLALLTIDHFYGGVYGFSFLTPGLKLRPPTLSDGSQATLLLLASLPCTLLLRRKKKPARKPGAPPAAAQAQPAPSEARRRATITPLRLDPRDWKVTRTLSAQVGRLSAGLQSSLKKAGVNPSNSQKNTAKPVTASGALKVSAPRAGAKISGFSRSKTVVRANGKKATGTALRLPARSRRGALKDVRLMGEEEHVCPYCLEKVDKSVTGGMVVCPECSTWHHQDCWDLTGACGVAHRNEL